MSDESSEKNTTVNQSGGITIEHADNVIVHGDMVGRDKINAGGSGTTPPPGGVPVPIASSAPPLELSIRITATAQTPDASLQVSVSVKDLDLEKGPFPFSLPFDVAVLNDLRWYLEVYPQWPVGPDYERAQQVEANLRAWGKALFDAVFAHPDARSVYSDFRKEKNPLIIRVEGRERMELPDGSKVDCLVVQPVIGDRGIFAEKQRGRVWVTDDVRRVPVQIQTRYPFGVITLRLERMTLAPASGFGG